MANNKYFHQINGYGDEVIYYDGRTFYARPKKLNIIKRLIMKFQKNDSEVPF